MPAQIPEVPSDVEIVLQSRAQVRMGVRDDVRPVAPDGVREIDAEGAAAAEAHALRGVLVADERAGVQVVERHGRRGRRGRPGREQHEAARGECEGGDAHRDAEAHPYRWTSFRQTTYILTLKYPLSSRRWSRPKS